MRHALVTWVATVLTALFCAAWASAAPKPQPVKPPSRSQPVKPHPPVGNLQKPPPANQNQRPHSHPGHPAKGFAHPYHQHRDYYIIYDGAYGFSPYYGGGYYPYYDRPYYYPYYPYLPPAYISAEQWYGPRAAMRLFGMDQQFANANANAGPWRNGKDADFQEPKKSADRATNAQAIALALKFIGYGDALFAQQKYAEANDRYRKASKSAPQLADAWFRQGFALSATGRYDLAQGAVKRGMKLNPKWPKSDFEINELYGPNVMSKTANLDAMANVAEGKPNDADLLFLIGVHLHFDGQPDRAKTFFQRAAQLAGGDDASADHIRAFLKNGK